MSIPFTELFNLSRGVTVIRTDSNQLEATINAYTTCEEVEPISADVLHAALDTINYLQKELSKGVKVELPKIRTLEYNVYGNPYSGKYGTHEDDFYEVQELEDALDKAGVKY